MTALDLMEQKDGCGRIQAALYGSTTSANIDQQLVANQNNRQTPHSSHRTSMSGLKLSTTATPATCWSDLPGETASQLDSTQNFHQFVDSLSVECLLTSPMVA